MCEWQAGIQQNAEFGGREHNGQLRRSLQWNAASIRSELGSAGTDKATFCKIMAEFRAGEIALNNVRIQVWLLCVSFVLLMSAPYRAPESLVLLKNGGWFEMCTGSALDRKCDFYFSCILAGNTEFLSRFSFRQLTGVETSSLQIILLKKKWFCNYFKSILSKNSFYTWKESRLLSVHNSVWLWALPFD